MSKTTNIMEEVEENFAAPGFRNNQDAVTKEMVEALRGDYDVVVLSAPTGFGKSLALECAGQMTGPAYYTTPLNALVDQLSDDEFLGDRLTTIKGRNNYQCVHPEDKGESVDQAICQRDDAFECDVKDSECPYYSRKLLAQDENMVATNLAFIMAESMVPPNDYKLGERNTLIVDECQGIEDFGMNFVGTTISKNTVPSDVWTDIDIPDVDDEEYPIDKMVEWLTDEVLDVVRDMMMFYDSRPSLTKSQAKDKDQLDNFYRKLQLLIEDIQENEWVYQIDFNVKKNKENEKKVVFKPIYIGRFLDNLAWDRAENIILSSATVPGGDWLKEIGLGDRKVKMISVGHEFPVENRPIIMDEDVGKMTYGERHDTALPMMKKIKEISEHYEGQKGMVHCRAYSIAQLLKRTATNNGMGEWFRDNVQIQDSYTRDQDLKDWMGNDKQLFFSVAMDEGIDLEGDLCRFQILAKVLYPSMADKRTDYRVDELGDWDWYNRKAAVQIQQAYGRAVRSKEDWAHFYVLDSSAKGLIQRDAEIFQKWFLEAINGMKVDPSRGM